MNEAETDQRLKETILRLIQEAPDPRSYVPDGLPTDADPIKIEQTVTQRRPNHRHIALVAVAAATFVAIAGLVVWDRTPDNTFVSTTPSQPRSTEADGPVRVEQTEFIWSRTPHDEEVFGGQGEPAIYSVVVGGPGFVAVGNTELDDLPEPPLGLATAGVWTSVDGDIWSRVPYDAALFNDDGGATVFAVTVGGPGLVAVGLTGPGASFVSERAAVWNSVDGLIWARVPTDDETFSSSEMYDVTAGGPGLVAVGRAGRNAAVWTSPDGQTWTRNQDNDDAFSGASMFSVTVGGPGLVAVGSSGGQAGAWTSPDGQTWTRVVDIEELSQDPVMFSVIAAGPGLVAVGADRTNAAVWTSPNGKSWTRVQDNGEAFNGASMRSVVSTADGLVAVGSTRPLTLYSPPMPDDGSGIVWTSIDGLDWVRQSDNESVFGEGWLSDVAVTDNGLVAVGAVRGDPDLRQFNNAAVWTASS